MIIYDYQLSWIGLLILFVMSKFELFTIKDFLVNSTDESFFGMYIVWLSFLYFVGKGLFASKEYSPGEFIVEYAGELINRKEGLKREKCYPLEKGSYIYFFLFDSKKYWYVQYLAIKGEFYDQFS